MRFILTTLLLVSILPLSYGQDASEIVEFNQIRQDLGLIKKGDKVKGQFVFRNISKKDVQIDIVSTCECTEAKWTSGLISPGDRGTIDYIFDSAKKDEVEAIDIDVYFVNLNPKTKNPYSIFLNYTFEFR